MVTIFAGRDANGTIRFLNEVSAGLACSCTCTVCGSRLVAKKGDINDWHFAHESGQTSPECLAGARNLLRQVAADWMRASGRFPSIEKFRQVVSAGEFTQTASWDAPILSVEWKSEDRFAATLELARGHSADLGIFVEGDADMPRRNNDRALLVLSLPMPEHKSFHSRDQLVEHIQRSMTGQWAFLPDLFSVLATTQADVDHEWREELARREKAAALRRVEAGRRWAGIRQQAQQAVEVANIQREPARLPPDDSHAIAPGALLPDAGAPFPEWAWDHKAMTGFFCLTFRDASQWLLYETKGAGLLLRPWPAADDGWDEALPPSIGIADESLQAYRVKSHYDFLMASRALVKSVHNTSLIAEVPDCFKLSQGTPN